MAIEVADAEGLDAVSMRRIARDLRAGAMSLYHYFDSRDELLELMADTIAGEMLVPVPFVRLAGGAGGDRATQPRHVPAAPMAARDTP